MNEILKKIKTEYEDVLLNDPDSIMGRGLCLVSSYLVTSEVLERKQHIAFTEYLLEHTGHEYIRKEEVMLGDILHTYSRPTGYQWEPGKSEPRLAWLDKHIKLTE